MKSCFIWFDVIFCSIPFHTHRMDQIPCTPYNVCISWLQHHDVSDPGVSDHCKVPDWKLPQCNCTRDTYSFFEMNEFVFILLSFVHHKSKEIPFQSTPVSVV